MAKEFNYWLWLRSALRKAWIRYPPRTECKNKARRPYEGTGRRKWEYQCAHCKYWFNATDIEIDHIIPAGVLTSRAHVAPFVNGLFCDKDNLQVLCKPCHKIKSKKERNTNAD